MRTIDRFTRALPGVSRLIGASGLLVSGRLVGAAANFIFALLLARALPVAEVGVAFAAISAAFLASILVTLNVESGSIRFLVAAKEAGDSATAGGFILFGRLILLAMSPVIALAIVAPSLFGRDAAGVELAICAAAATPALGWLRLAGAHATAIGRPVTGSIPRTALQPLIVLALFEAAMFAGAPATALTALYCFLGSIFATACVQYVLLRKHLRVVAGGGGRSLRDWRNWILNGVFLAPGMALQEHFQHAVIIAAALALGDPEVALLAILLRFTSLIRFGVLAINVAASPDISRAIARTDTQSRDSHLRAAAFLKTPAVALAAAAVILFAPQILALFGPDYANGRAALAWLTLAPLASALFGPNQLLLNISGARFWVFAASIAAAVALFAFVPLGGWSSGAAGAAAAAVCVYGLWEGALFAVVRVKLGIDASFVGAFREAKPSAL